MKYLAKPDEQELIQVILELKPSDKEIVLIMIGEKTDIDIKSLIDILNKKNIIFFGGIVPGIIYNESYYYEGVLLFKSSFFSKPVLFKGLKDNLYNFSEKMQIFSQCFNKKLTALILVDGLTGNISGFLSAVFNKLGSSVNYFGGGTGSISLVQKPSIFTNEGIFQDAAVLCLLELQCALGVQHGWDFFAGPLIATKTRKNVISELNWDNAFEVYKSVVEKECKKTISQENLFDIALSYPLAILKEGTESIVRNPVVVNEHGELICVGEVMENGVLAILKGNKESLINAAKKVVKDCCIVKKHDIRAVFIVDCISRSLFLAEDFSEELIEARKEIRQCLNAEVTSFGILSLGEISSSGEGFLEFYNKTFVMGVFYE